MAASSCILTVLVGLCIAAPTVVAQGRIDDHLEKDWGSPKVSTDGQVYSLSLAQDSGGSGIRSKTPYMYVRADVQIKLAPGDSAGTVTTFFLTSEGANHDEIDLEFLGNVSGQPYTLHTNIYTSGDGQKEQQFRLWFDPTTAFHTYSIVWTKNNIVLLVDGTPIREFRNYANKGAVAYPSTQPMQVKGSLWDANWATQGGRFQIDWTHGPFVAQYRNFAATKPPGSYYVNEEEMERTRAKYMIYNYCTDLARFNGKAPPPCSMRGGSA